jgi:opine dehydrogenase
VNVAILGAGAIALGSAALIESTGHRAAVWSPSGRGTAALARDGKLDYGGVMTGIAHPAVIADLAQIAGFDVVLIAVPVNGHRAVMERVAPRLASHQTEDRRSGASAVAALPVEARLRAWRASDDRVFRNDRTDGA